MSGTFTAIDSKTNKIAWQHKTPYRIGTGGGSTVIAEAWSSVVSLMATSWGSMPRQVRSCGGSRPAWG